VVRVYELSKGFHQYRARDPKLFQALFDGTFQNALAIACQAYEHSLACAQPAHKIIGLGAVYQFHSAVVPASKVLRERTYRRLNVPWKPSYGQKQLILPGLDPCVFRGLIAEIQVPVDVMAKLGQCSIVGFRGLLAARISRHNRIS
jgi:hypothetical protein